MKKKILSLILAVLILVGSMPLSVLAAEAGNGASQPSSDPVLSVTSDHFYKAGADYRALPDDDGNFHLEISVKNVDESTESGDILVYYRTVDDSAVAAWGDYESVGTKEEAFVTLNAANGYKEKVLIRSTVIDDGFITPNSLGTLDEGRVVSRRFIFDVTRVVGNDALKDASSRTYCYLGSSRYHSQSNSAHPITDSWGSASVKAFEEYRVAFRQETLERYEEQIQENPLFGIQVEIAINEHLAELAERIWGEYPDRVPYSTLYHTLDEASLISTPQIKYKGSYSDHINLKFGDEWRNYASSGWVDLGISINGTIMRDFWDSEGAATFNLYYTYEGEKRIALTLYLKGEFDDSTFFGWEHAFEYAFDGIEDGNRDDHMDENFIGFTLYDNDGRVIYEVKNEEDDIDDVCEQLKNAMRDGYVAEMLNGMSAVPQNAWDTTAYYLRLPSNFALADSYSYEFISDSEDEDEIRWLEDVELSFTLFGYGQPKIAKDELGDQMVITNLDTIKEGDKIRMSVRFDKPVYISDEYNKCYIIADIYNDLGACLASGVKLYLSRFDSESNNYCYYALDTLVFEGDMPTSLNETRIAYLKNIRIEEGKGSEENSTEGIKSYFTEQPLLSGSINPIYVQKDLRTPVAILGTQITENWIRSKSVDIYVDAKDTGAKFNDFVTVYYQWTDSEDAPSAESYSSKVIFNTKEDGDAIKSIIGTGNGMMYLHLYAVSSYGKSSESCYGPFKFDNLAPQISADSISAGLTKTGYVLNITLPDDNDSKDDIAQNVSGLKYIKLYRVNEDGADVLLYTYDTAEHSEQISPLSIALDADKLGVGKHEKKTISFYLKLADNIGNENPRAAEFSLTFDTNDYLTINGAGPYGEYADKTDSVEADDAFNFIYDYKAATEAEDSGVYYAFFFETKADDCRVALTYKGSPLVEGSCLCNITDCTDCSCKTGELEECAHESCDCDRCYMKEYDYTVEQLDTEGGTNLFVVWFNKPMKSGKYDVQLIQNGSGSISRVYTVYATDGQNDDTPTKDKVTSGTLLTNSVYQLSSEYPYFYYMDADGAIQKQPYNGTKLPATFSSLTKAKEYVYYKELGDIYLIRLSADVAGALISGTAEHRIADGETVTPQAGHYWIRYKSESWTPTSGTPYWVYYYYSDTSAVLSEDALSPNLQTALNAVANRIVGYGRSVILTDTSLFLGSAQGDKMLDENGMPYLTAEQIHNDDEFSSKTACGSTWSTDVAFAADKNIYKSNVSVGVAGSDTYKEYPLVGIFELPESSRFQYMTFDQYQGSSSWKPLSPKAGESFIDLLRAPGVHYIRELSDEGVSVFAIYIDKVAPKVNFFRTDEDGERKEISVDGVTVREIRSTNLYIGGISAEECDRLSYVAVYKVSSLSLVGIYTANDLSGAPIRLEDGNYYIVVSDRSGNHYTVTAKISSSDLEPTVTTYPDRFIRLTVNRRSDQILRYEVRCNGELVTSTYQEEQRFDKAGTYTIYIQDIYGNEFYKDDIVFERKYPTADWKYLGTDDKYHAYNKNDADANGFVLTQVADNRYKISASVETRFSISSDYAYEFVGSAPKYKETVGAETVVTIESGQSFNLKIYYKNHKDCYSLYSGVVDVTPPSVSVSAEMDIVKNGEYALFEEWLKGSVGETVTMSELYFVFSDIVRRNVENGTTVSSASIKIDAGDVNGLSSLEVYLDGVLIEKQDDITDFSQITVSKAGDYRIVAKDTLGNTSEFSFKNGVSDGVSYSVDGVGKEIDPHGHLNFNADHDYTKVDYGNTSFLLDIAEEADVFLSVGVSGGSTVIYGFRIASGCVYPLSYKIAADKNGDKTVELSLGEVILDVKAKDFVLGKDYPIGKSGEYAVYASVASDKTVSIKVYAPDDEAKVVAVGARIELNASRTTFVAAELSKRGSDISLDGLGTQERTDIKVSEGFTVDESSFESERITDVRLYYSKLNDLDISSIAGKTNIYTADNKYTDEGFYLLVVKNSYGNEKAYRIAVSRSFGVTSSVTFEDGHKIYYSKDHNGTLYSDGEITLDVLDEGVTVKATLDGADYTRFITETVDGILYLTFCAEGSYSVTLTDSYGNEITKKLEINKSEYTVADDLLTGYNDKALKRDEGYTNQKLSVDKAVYDREGIYYLAIRYGDDLTVLFDAFAESPVSSSDEDLKDIIGAKGDGVYEVICRNRYGADVTSVIHYRETPTLKLERTTRSKTESEAYDLGYALSHGFWSNYILSFFTDAETYVFTVDGVASDCPRVLVFENAGDYGSFEYEITYIDEYGFEYSLTAYLVRRNITVTVSPSVSGTEINGILNTQNDVSITFGENVYATYTKNGGEPVAYNSGDVLKNDGVYKFTVIDYAANATTLTIVKDTAVEFSITESSGGVIPNGGITNSSKVSFNALNKDSAYIQKALLNGVVQENLTGKLSGDGKWELVVADELGNTSYFCFYILTRAQNGFAYTTPYEYRITEMWYDGGDGVAVSYMNFVSHGDSTSSFDFSENGRYVVVMTSDATGASTTFEFTVNTNPPDVSLVGCSNGETTLNDVTLAGCKVGDRIRIYKTTRSGEELVEEIEITMASDKIPVITEGGTYRIVVESEAGVAVEFSFVRKHVMNTAGSIFVMVMIGLSVVGLFTGLVYRNKSKTDD